MKIYQAGPLFSDAERAWHRQLRTRLEDCGFTVIWPGDLISAADVQAWGNDAARRIMETDRDALLSCDAVVALLDGPQVDDGTAWEIGFACAREIPVIGIRTDFRQGGDTGTGLVNAMIEGSCQTIVRSVKKLVPALRALSLKKSTGQTA